MDHTPNRMRRAAMAACTALPLTIGLGALGAQADETDPDWRLFKQRFISTDGRVNDAGQNNISHSEGQGYALLLALHYGDRASFELVWNWTRSRLQVRPDALLAWAWQAERGITDQNNASDGDLLVAWALLRASEKFNSPDLLVSSARLAREIREKLLRDTKHGLILLPGMVGFEKPEGANVNLSYLVWPALREIGRADPSPQWEALIKNGLHMLDYSRFGRWRLPPDWLKLRTLVAPADSNPPRFGYDALRIPLYLIWGGVASAALLEPYRTFWSFFSGARFLPSWTNLLDDSVDSYDADAGVRAIAQLVAAWPNLGTVRLGPLDARQGYYSSALLLLCKVALHETGKR